MAFDPFEISQEDSEPIEVYKFTLGSEPFYFSSTEEEITIGTDVYTPTTISHSELAIGRDERKRIVTIDVPASNLLAQRYVGTPPGERASLSIFRIQRKDTAVETALIYKGSILTVQFPKDEDSAKIHLQSIEAASSRAIPRMTFMGMCNHILYDDQCGVDPLLFRHIGSVASILGNDITVNGAGASGLDFTGGFVKPTGFTDFRLVISQIGDVLTLLLPFEQDPTGGNVEVFAGCDHLLDSNCQLVFDNAAEYGGFYFVPKKNVFQVGLS